MFAAAFLGRSSLKNRVKNGIKFLNRYNPGWVRKINTARLDMDNCQNCILGQLYSHYVNGLRSLRLAHRNFSRAQSMGFRGRNQAENDKLRSIWIELITNIKKHSNATPDYMILPTDDEDDDPNKEK